MLKRSLPSFRCFSRGSSEDIDETYERAASASAWVARCACGPDPSKEQGPHKSEDVVRVTTNLVQVDAIVTDKSGRQVVDLRLTSS
jgi:hypothetical protein